MITLSVLRFSFSVSLGDTLDHFGQDRPEGEETDHGQKPYGEQFYVHTY